MATMRAVQVTEPRGPFELVEREVPEPGRGEVRVRVEACGVCHSDSLAKDGGFPGVEYPVIPGHEVAGVIDALGDGVAGWELGARVGVGWFGGNCGHCDPCRRGDFIWCVNSSIPGITTDGGYGDFLVVSSTALASIPEDLKAEDAAPLLCGDIPVWQPPTSGPETIELADAAITTVIWSTGFRCDWSWVKLPGVRRGRVPDHHRGVTSVDGLYVVGLPWLHTWGSGRFAGIARDAGFVAGQIAVRAGAIEDRSSAAA